MELCSPVIFPSPPITPYIIAVKIAAGSAIKKFILNLSFISEPTPFAAEIVVSDIIDKLSPK